MLRGWQRFIGALVMAASIAVGLSPARPQEAGQGQPRPSAAAAPRLALVIGNATYAAAPLPTAANDAGLVAQSLAQAGFAVTAANDVDADGLRKAFADMLASAKAAGPEAVIVVYLSGYGLQWNGDTFYVPVDAAPRRESDVAAITVDLGGFVQALAATPAKARIVVEDLARDNPFVKDGEPLAGGLPLVAAAKGSLVATNAAPGTAATPDVVPYGVYARALAEMLAEPGLPLSVVFARVRLRVSALTNGAVIPWSDDQLDGDPVLIPAGPSATPTPPPVDANGGAPAAFWATIERDTLAAYQTFAKSLPRDTLTARMRMLIAVRREATIWSDSRAANDPRAYWTYMRRYPHGPHLFDARRRLALLHAALEPPPRFDIFVYPDVTPPPPAEVALVDHPVAVFEDPQWAPLPPPPATLVPPPREAFYEDLPPPPLVPLGVMPIPVPVAGNRHDAVTTGTILQPGSPGRVAVASRLGPGAGSVMTMTSADTKVMSRTVTTLQQGSRTLLQTGPGDTPISRTTTLRDRGTLTTIQTGPKGEVLSKAVSRGDADGSRSTTITNGADQMIATIRSGRDGVVTVKRGNVPVLDQTYVVSDKGRPVAVPLAQALASRPKTVGTAPQRSVAAVAEPVPDAGVRPSLPSIPPLAGSIDRPAAAPPISASVGPFGRLSAMPAPGPTSVSAKPNPTPTPGPGREAVQTKPQGHPVEPTPIPPTAPSSRQPLPPRRAVPPPPIREAPRPRAMPQRVEPRRTIVAPRPVAPSRRPNVVATRPKAKAPMPRPAPLRIKPKRASPPSPRSTAPAKSAPSKKPASAKPRAVPQRKAPGRRR